VPWATALHDPVVSLSAPAGRGQKFFAENRPFIALRRVASSRTQYLSGWNVGAASPGRTSRPACAFTPSFVPDSQQMVWPSLPVPASMLRVFGSAANDFGIVRVLDLAVRPLLIGRSLFTKRPESFNRRRHVAHPDPPNKSLARH
jgi:hypothetical protein